MIFTIGILWRRAISKSLGSCAAVTFTAPVPKSASTNSSAMIGIMRLTSGNKTSLPIMSLYLGSFGFTATAPSPSIVSGRVVAIVI
ncbi:unannotated protein [freshwater metagenome]|uniref:Unannotated protein n=1 Tax=freshwater metagenome TaxID=449393 RepID=A0A6J6Y6P3_9ZZZZ